MTVVLVLCSVLLSPPFLQSQGDTYTVSKIFDGDTILVRQGKTEFKVRIAAMDAPEYDQPWGQEATRFLKKLVKGKGVSLEKLGHDVYERVLAHVYINDNDVALTMISEGLATYYRPSCVDYHSIIRHLYNYDPDAYVKQENAAKKRHRGIWSEVTPALPCEHRLKKSSYSRKIKRSVFLSI